MSGDFIPEGILSVDRVLADLTAELEDLPTTDPQWLKVAELIARIQDRIARIGSRRYPALQR